MRFGVASALWVRLLGASLETLGSAANRQKLSFKPNWMRR